MAYPLDNLGGYGWLPRLAKRAGGPGRLVAGIFVAGIVATKTCQATAPCVKDWWTSRQQGRDVPGAPHVVTTTAMDDQGLALSTGDEFRVMTRDGDAVMIEVVGRDDNPWMVSAEFLARVSDFRD